MSHLYYLIGPPGSGKRTIGKELSRLTGAALIDNHLINDPVFIALGGNRHREAWPENVWEMVGQVYRAVLEAVKLAPHEVSHIFTNYLADDPNEPKAIERLRELAAARDAQFLPVYLTCPVTALERRMGSPERAEREKINDVGTLREVLERHGVLPVPNGAFTLDTSRLSPTEAAQAINEHDKGLK
ncbi:hypothetical protein [Deinococcus fonticola]|uniref:hypothetical protein n=1 Tax=Deinococcus fonticola TaxID=2528713 RepID=UPI0010757E70|nr:hypothetical protein [Deinococcus fonticola]